jgi:RNA polymerase sporulation-specific sigma factor
MHPDVSSRTDEDLIRLTAQKNNEAFVELASRYLWLIRTKARQCEVPAFDTDDLSQEGLIGLYDAALTYDPNGSASFRTYAGVCISNRFTSVLRKQTGLKNKPLNDFVSIFDENSVADLSSNDMESTVLFREMLAGVLSQVKKLLSDQEQRVLGMYLEGYNRKEIAQVLSLPLKSVDNTMQRVRRKYKHYRGDV